MASRRPRPRVRSSVDAFDPHDAIDLAENENARSSASPVIPPPWRLSSHGDPSRGVPVGSAAAARAATATATVLRTNGAIEESANEDDDFFDRSRRSNSKRFRPASAARHNQHFGGGTPVLDKVTEGADDALGHAFGNGSLSGNEDGNDHWSPSSSGSDSDDDASRRKRAARRRAFKPMLSHLAAAGQTRAQGASHRSGNGHGDELQKSRSRNRSAAPHGTNAGYAGNGGSLEEEDEDNDDMQPAPQAPKELREHLYQVISKELPISRPLEDDEDVEGGSQPFFADEELRDLDPDLVQHMRGKRGAEARRLLRELDKRRQTEQVRRPQQRTARPVSPQRISPVKGPGIASAPLELSDSDSDVAGRAQAQARVSLARRSERQSRTSMRAEHERSSSPAFEIVSVNSTSSSGPRVSSFATQRSSDATTNMIQSKEATEAHLAASKEPDEEAVAEERLKLVLKGGEHGALVSHVQVKPTTTVQKLVAHFASLHSASIPASSRTKVRLRFDGDDLQPTDTMADAGIEDEEQLDVVW